MAENIAIVRVSMVWTNERATKALLVLCEVLNDIGEDFGYRDDVKRAIRAAKYLTKNVGVQADCDNVAKLFEDE